MRQPLRISPRCLAGLSLVALPSVASAQIGWVEFAKDNSRISAPNNLVLGDTEEKDYAWGDLDKNGWTDLVIVRKQPFTTQGRKTNVLLMNYGSVLTDRTSDFATATDAAMDNGFETPTNDRDVILVDLDNDTWLDVVTATTLTPGEPKRISHPRVYMNLGNDGNGDWLGLMFEKDRTPQIKLSNGSNYFPFFCGVGAGDVTGDGFADLYFADYDVAGFSDVNDRLFINDGSATFTDESFARMTSAMLHSPFGTSATIIDMNGDGVNDVVKNTGLGQTSGNPLVAISYNNPANEGFFNILDQPYQGSPYHVSVGDLNKDGNPDMIISDDGSDRFMLHQGVDGLGRVIWSSAFTFQGGDDGFGSNNIIEDLDNDGWGDAIISDVDVDIPGCDRRLHIYHNTGGSVGGNVTLKEESGGGSVGVKGIGSNALVGMHDVAIFDIDNDGDKDMIFGRCTGTVVWLNTEFEPGVGTPYCDTNPANVADISLDTNDCGVGSINVSMTGAPTNQFGYLLIGAGNNTVTDPPGAEGDLCLIGGQIGRYSLDAGVTDGSGGFSTDILNAVSGGGGGGIPNPPGGNICTPAGQTWNFQFWHRDGMNPSKFSKAISVTFQ